MSELIENNGLTQGISVTSRREQNGTVAGDEDPIKEEQRSPSNTDTNLGKNGDSEENSIGQNVVEKPAMEIEMPSESKIKAEIVINSGKHFRNNVQGADFDVKKEKENDLGKENNQMAGNGDTVFAIPMEEAHSEGDHFTETPLPLKQEGGVGNCHVQAEGLSQSFSFNPNYNEGYDSGTDEEQAAFMKELENFFKERSLEFKPPKFYGEGLNCLKLWRAVTRLGGYDQVTQCKLWRQVGESFKPPKTCTTVSWSFRCFYEKALLDYEKDKVRTGELQVPVVSIPEPMSVDNLAASNQALSSGRARRDSAARAMQGWHSQRLLGNGEVGDPIIKDKGSISFLKKDKLLKSIGLPLKKKKPSSIERAVKVARAKSLKPQVDSMVVDVGAPADWVKINVRRTKDCYEVYALVPGLLREEVHVQSDPAGRLIISGEPEQPDNPWGVTSFKKVITLPSRIDPHQTSAVVTLHGQLFVRVPYEQSDL
ncbi:AT-rich interactive domain-containing protein 3 [Platanthera guangdongensis]|uniref:AT-rich interactive domain-containing protein 3 n=1 Tax=Platanthera guangdongensis TaxID=2320717 RepID=A0ABR2MJ11_9ASPA